MHERGAVKDARDNQGGDRSGPVVGEEGGREHDQGRHHHPGCIAEVYPRDDCESRRKGTDGLESHQEAPPFRGDVYPFEVTEEGLEYGHVAEGEKHDAAKGDKFEGEQFSGFRHSGFRCLATPAEGVGSPIDGLRLSFFPSRTMGARYGTLVSLAGLHCRISCRGRRFTFEQGVVGRENADADSSYLPTGGVVECLGRRFPGFHGPLTKALYWGGIEQS